MNRDDLRRDLPRVLQSRVGGYFHNTRVSAATCSVCRGPTTDGSLCLQCRRHREAYGARLADRVLTLTYVRGYAPTLHQSAHVVRAYKGTPPSRKAAEDMALMVLAATLLHGDCVTRVAGRPWSAVSFVPSAARPGPDHPVAQLARQAHGHTTDQRFLLDLGPAGNETDRVVRRDRFVVKPGHEPRVDGEHVLLVDDTWTTGSKVQSAALAIRAAGAATITVLCVARYCRHDWSDHRALLDSCAAPYDAGICPVTGSTCPA